MWAISFFSSLILVFAFSTHIVLSILLIAIVTGCMHGINIMLIGILPSRYKNENRVSTISGMLNAFTYVGSALSTYGTAALADSFGWKFTITIWCAITLMGTALTFIVIRKLKYQRKYMHKLDGKLLNNPVQVPVNKKRHEEA